MAAQWWEQDAADDTAAGGDWWTADVIEAPPARRGGTRGEFKPFVGGDAQAVMPDTRPVLDRPVPGYERVQSDVYGQAVASGDQPALQALSRAPWLSQTDQQRVDQIKLDRKKRDDTAARSRDVDQFGMDALVALAKGGNSVMQLPVAALAPGSTAYNWLSANGKQLEALESDQMKARRQGMAERIASSPDEMAKFATSLGEMISNPSLGFAVAAEQLPIMGAILATGGVGGLAGRGAVGAAARLSPAVAVADAISGGGVAAAGATRGALAATGAASALAAGGDAAQGTFDALMDPRQTPTSLLSANPDYRAMVDSGTPPAEARRAIAVSKSRLAAMLAAPLGVIAGRTGVEAVAAGAVKRGGALTGVKTAAKEMAGEIPEELGTQAASNFAIGQVDPNRRLTEGFGETAAQTLVGTAPVAIAGGIHAGTERPDAAAVAPIFDRFRGNTSADPFGGLAPTESVMYAADGTVVSTQTPEQRAQRIAALARETRVENQPTAPLTPDEILAAPMAAAPQSSARNTAAAERPDAAPAPRVDVNSPDAVLAALGLRPAAAAAAPTPTPAPPAASSSAPAAPRERIDPVMTPAPAPRPTNPVLTPERAAAIVQRLRAGAQQTQTLPSVQLAPPAAPNETVSPSTGMLADGGRTFHTKTAATITARRQGGTVVDVRGGGFAVQQPAIQETTNVEQPDVAALARPPAGASDGRSDSSARSGGAVGPVPAQSGPVVSPAAAPAAGARPVGPVADAGGADVALNNGAPAPVPSQTNRRRASARARMAVVERDSMLQALAKMGGIRRDVMAREFGMPPGELRHTVSVGGLKGFPFRANGGMGMDRAIEALTEAGYFRGVAPEDLRNEFEAAAYDELGGRPMLTAEGQMRRGAEMQRMAEEDAQAEFDAESAAEREAILAEAGMSDAEAAAAVDDDIEWAVTSDANSTERAMRELGFTDQDIADELARTTDRTSQASAAEARPVEPEQASTAGRTGSAEARPAPATGSGTAEGLTLEAQSAADLKAKTDREDAAKAADAKEQKRLADKAKADAQRDEFTLTGSDRAADADPAQQPMFSRSNATTGVGTQDAKAVVQGIREVLPKAPPIHLHESIKQAPKELAAFIRKAGAESDVEAVFHDGEIHVFPHNIADIERMQFVVGHHEIRHYGMRGLLGPKLGMTMLGIYSTNPSVKAAVKDREKLGYGESRVIAIEEVLADMPAEKVAELKGGARLIAMLRDALRVLAGRLRSAGFVNLADSIEPKTWTDADVARFVMKAEEISRTGAAQFRAGGTVFGRDTSTPMPEDRNAPGNGDERPGANQKAAVIAAGRAFVQKVEALAEKHGRVYLRWSPSAKRDLTGNQQSRDFVAGSLHAGLSAVEISADTHPIDIAAAVAEYGFLRMQDRNSVPRVYLAQRVGTDSDSHALIKPTELLAQGDDTILQAVDAHFDDVMHLEDEIATAQQRLGRITDKAAKEIVSKALAKDQQKLAQLLNETSASAGPDAPVFSRSNPNHTPEQTEALLNGRSTVGGGWPGWKDASNRVHFAPGAWLYSKARPAVMRALAKAALNPMSPQMKRHVRAMQQQVERSKGVATKVAGEAFTFSEADRQLVSDIVEGEMAAGVVPPEHAARMAAGINTIMDQQTNDLVALGMLSPESADRWRGAYLPRFYRSKLMQTLKEGGKDLWNATLKQMQSRPAAMQGIKGQHLKGRGLWETAPVAELPNWLDHGWQVRDPKFDPNTSANVQVWRDFTRAERDKMGEIRDAGFRFTLGYLSTQRDIALGRLFQGIAADGELAAENERAGWVQVPDGTIEGTGGVKRYGKLAGMWVSPEVMSHLVNYGATEGDAKKLYRKAMSMWKEGKVVLNPVSHGNNIMSNVSMAHFAGVSYWDAHKYAGALMDIVRGRPMIQEAKDAGLFLGTMTQEELLSSMPNELRALAAMQESKAEAAAGWVWNALSLWLRKPAAAVYQAEDLFFRYLIYRDARARGLNPEQSTDYAQRYLFTYDDLPATARTIRDYGIPFFAYTYKVIPALLHTAAHYPHRLLAPAGLMWGLNALSYAIAAGEDDEDWTERIRAYLNDPTRRQKADALEGVEREALPPWMKGNSSFLATPKAVRLGMDEVTGLPLFWDIAQIMPGGNMFDVENNAGGIWWPQSLTPSHPLLTTMAAMLWNKDAFFGKEITDSNDTTGEAAEKRAAWLWRQFTPAVALGNYHSERMANVVAQITGEPVRWLPNDATGFGKDGLPVQPKLAALQTVGIKVRPIDIDMAEDITQSQRQKMIRDIEAEIRRLQRLSQKGAVSDRNLEAQMNLAEIKGQRLRDGLTVDGDKPK